MPTISSLLKSAIDHAKERLELLLMLALLSGIFSSFLYRQAGRKLNELFATLENGSSKETGLPELAEAISQHSGTIILGYIGLTIATSVMLPTWARTVAPSATSKSPSYDGMAIRVSRSFHAFTATMFATILSSVVFLVLGLLIINVVTLLGGIGQLLVIASSLFALWASLFFASAAHVVICFRSLDKSMSFRAAFIILKLFVRPAVGSLAVLWLSFSFINLLLGNLVASTLTGDWSLSLTLVVNGATMFMTSALHMAVLYSLPGIKEVT